MLLYSKAHTTGHYGYKILVYVLILFTITKLIDHALESPV
jgi:hypothetical protein